MIQRTKGPDGAGSGKRDGFALPVAILAVAVVGMLVTGGIHLASQESRVGQATERAVRAFYVAESGLSRVLASWQPAQGALQVWGPPDTIQGSAGEGQWEAVVRRVGPAVYLVRTTGEVESTGGGAARRTLAAMARLHTLSGLEPPGALATLGDVSLQGNAAVHGEDEAPPGWDASLCPDPLQDLPGVVTDAGSSVSTQGNAEYTGTPPHHSDPDLGPEDFDEFGDLDWDGLTSLANLSLPPGGYSQVAPRTTGGGACDTSHSENWGDPGDPAGVCGSYFPIVHIQGDAALSGGGQGQGILLVDGNLEVAGGFEYFGIIIVQGILQVSGTSKIHGGVMSANAEMDVGGVTGTGIIQNSTCAVRRSLLNNPAVTRLRPLGERGWVDITGATL